METTRKDIIAIVIGFVVAGILAVLVVHSQSSQATPVVHLNPVNQESTSSMLVTTTSAKAPPLPAKPVKHAVKSTTTTSEIPPPLTAEQEAKIPGPVVEGDADADEHMPAGEDRDYVEVQQ